MAEVAGLILGSVSLTALFNNCVDNFNYIQLGRKFGRDFETSLVKLDLIKLRFSRWGESMRLADLDTRTRQSIRSQQNEEILGHLLGQISFVFKEAEKASSSFKVGANHNDLALHAGRLSNDFATLHDSLQKKMEKRCKDLQRRTKLSAKVKWALYTQKHLRTLLEDLSSLVDSLISVFPAIQRSQQELCQAEVSDLHEESLRALEKMNEGSDKLLGQVVTQKLKVSRGQSWRGVEGSESVVQHMGNKYRAGQPSAERHKRQEWSNIRGGGNATQHMGDDFTG